jgi:hypothetical protein
VARSKVRLDFHDGKGIREIMSGPEARELVKSLADADRDACNEESSWGGYASTEDSDDVRARARVWSFDNRNDEARDNRMIRNLDAGA